MPGHNTSPCAGAAVLCCACINRLPGWPCRKAEGEGASKDEAVPWDEEEVYKFLLSYYSGEQPAAGKGSNSSGGGSRRASWSDAGLLMCVVAACVYGVLRRSGQYALRKSDSRIL